MEGKIKDFRWRYQIPLDSALGMLFDYIQNRELHPTSSTKEIMVQALSGYYMPIAHSVANQSPEKVKQIAYDSVLSLQRQIDRLVSEFELDRNIVGSYSLEEAKKAPPKKKKNSSKIVSESEEEEKVSDSVNQSSEFDTRGIMGLISSCQDE